MRKYNRIFLIVLDSLGIGAMADSEKFGDVGVNTFGHIWESQGNSVSWWHTVCCIFWAMII